MFILFPYSHEDMKVQRIPVVTISLIAVCVLFFIIVRIDTDHIDKRLQTDFQEFFEFYIEHSYLEVPERFYTRFPYMRKMLESFKDYAFFPQPLQEDETEDIEAIILKQQCEMEKMIDNILNLINRSLLYNYGHVPKSGFNPLTLITYGFIHYGFFHLLTNMLILWITGSIIEDKLGRLYYILFYLSALIFAGWTHSIIINAGNSDAANIPLIGASGGIAGLMGAFLVRMTRTKINIFYFIIIFFRAGTFQIPAYLLLPLWFIFQLIQGLIQLDVPVSNTAFWAHVGGFIYGFAIYLVLRSTKFEEKYISSAIDKKIAVFDQELLKALEYIDCGKTDAALKILLRIEKTSQDPVIFSELAKIFLSKNDYRNALRHANKAYSLLFKKELYDIVINLYLDIKNINDEFLPNPSIAYKIIGAFRQKKNLDEAKQLCIRLFNSDKHSPYSARAVIIYADMLYKDEGKKEDAVSFLKKASAFYRSNNEASDEIKNYLLGLEASEI